MAQKYRIEPLEDNKEALVITIQGQEMELDGFKYSDYEFACYRAIASNVLIVAICNTKMNTWNVRIKSAPGNCFDKEWLFVAQWGEILNKTVATFYFSYLAEIFTWED
jgi:hypothetical protein